MKKVNERRKQWETLNGDDTEAAVQAAIALGIESLGQTDPDEIEIPPDKWGEFFRELMTESGRGTSENEESTERRN